MAAVDYYRVLGLRPGASQAEVKRAYRRLAVRFHPDRNPGDAWAEERFKQASEAYQALVEEAAGGRGPGGAPGARTDATGRWRRTRRAGSPGAGRSAAPQGDQGPTADEAAGASPADAWSARRAGHPPKVSPPADRLQEVEIGLESVVEHRVVPLELDRREPCERCGGGGEEPGTGRATCPACGGQGLHRLQQGMFTTYRPCPNCGGSGSLLVSPCGRCQGGGVTAVRRALKVRLPPGIEDGSELRLVRQGDWAVGSRAYGDLVLRVRVRDHDLFRRDGFDLLLDLSVGFPQLALGTVMTVPTVGGERRLRVPPGTPNGTVFRLAGQGLPRRGGRRGDLKVRVEVMVPGTVSGEQRDLLVQFAALCGQEVGSGTSWLGGGVRRVTNAARRLLGDLIAPLPGTRDTR